jgi:hypothetical protein
MTPIVSLKKVVKRLEIRAATLHAYFNKRTGEMVTTVVALSE